MFYIVLWLALFIIWAGAMAALPFFQDWENKRKPAEKREPAPAPVPVHAH